MLESIGRFIIDAADILGGYPLFFLLIGGGLYLFIRSGAVSLRRLPDAIRELRRKQSGNDSTGQISSVQALASVIAATVGVGNIAGVAIALVMGGPGAIFWMWVSALVGMSTKFHEGTLAIMYKGKDDQGRPQGGPMHIIEQGLGRRWTLLGKFFAVAGMFGTLAIMNSNQLTEAFMATFVNHDWLQANETVSTIGSWLSLDNVQTFRMLFGMAVAVIVGVVVLGGIKRIAHVATILVPFMVCLYFVMVLAIIITHIEGVPAVFRSIFAEAFNLRAGFGALAGIALIGARRAALVNDAGIGTASIMHGASNNDKPVREGLIAMLGPGIDSGLVCTLSAVAILLCGDLNVEGVKGLEVAMGAFRNALPYGDILLMCVVICFALSSMFSFSFYGSTCASYLFGSRSSRWYTWFFILSLVVFAVIPLEAVVGICDLSYALMAIPTMIALLALSPKVRCAARQYFDKNNKK